MLERYAVFAGDTYYPTGGWADFRGSFRTPEDALQSIPDLPPRLVADRGSAFGRDHRSPFGTINVVCPLAHHSSRHPTL